MKTSPIIVLGCYGLTFTLLTKLGWEAWATVAGSIAAMVLASRAGTPLVAVPPDDETAEDLRSKFALQVIDDVTSEPRPGVKVTITVPGKDQQTYTTDAQGRIEIDDIDPGECDVTCELEDNINKQTFDAVRLDSQPML